MYRSIVKRQMKKIVFNVLFLIVIVFGANAQDVKEQVIQLDGGSCVVKEVVEIPGGTTVKYVRVSFEFTLDEKTNKINALMVLNQGELVVGKRKIKASAIVLPVEEDDNSVSLTFDVPAGTKVETLKFVFKKQEFPLSEHLQK